MEIERLASTNAVSQEWFDLENYEGQSLEVLCEN